MAVAARADENAALYLGDDYPVFVRSLDPADLEADMIEITAGFGGPDWRLAQVGACSPTQWSPPTSAL